MKQLYQFTTISKRLFYTCLCLLSILTIHACKKDTTIKTASAVSIYQITVEDPTDFSFLKTAIKRAGLVSKLSGDGNYTIFAPTNTAFKNAGFSDTIAVQGADSTILLQMLNYHMLPQNQTLDVLPVGASSLNTILGKPLNLKKSASGAITINGANVTSQDHQATNGILHVINRVLVPAIGDMATVIAGNANLTFLAAAIARASQGSTNFNQLLTGSTSYTLFAPNNAAFIAGGYPTLAAVTAADPNTLANLLNYHLIAGQSLTTDFTDNTSIASLRTNVLYLNQPSLGNTLINGVLINGSNANNLATNGVVHIVSKILVPPTLTLVQTITANTNLTYLNAAIIRASAGSTNFTQLLSGADTYTVFAPTNAAFVTAGYATITVINAADPATLATLLNNQVMAGRRFSTMFVEGSTSQSLAKSPLTFSIVSGFKVKGNSNTTTSNLLPIDVLATNGVVHVSDQVLKP